MSLQKKQVTLTNKEILDELLKKQLKNVPTNRLSYNDIVRLSKYIKSSIFDENQCSLWSGYVTNSDNEYKGIYINFYYNGKKVALHRLLYCNYIGELGSNEYLKFSCVNKGKCCNITHIQKFKYIEKNQKKKESKNINNKKESIKIKKKIKEARTPPLLTLNFD